MKLYRFWGCAEKSIRDAEGNALLLRKWGGSNASLDSAREEARRAVEELARRLTLKAPNRYAKEYAYGTRDVPEELIELLSDDSGITRNRYGCLVLNTARLMIADIDFPHPNLSSRLGALFRGRKLDRSAQEAEARGALARWLQHHADMGVRIYRTAGGLRYLFTHAPVPPDETAFRWLTELGSDRLYVQLCKAQQCFRARLTPKPWRVGVQRPPDLRPDSSQERREEFTRKWLPAYERNSAAYATCTFVEHQGRAEIHESLTELVQLHDRHCRADSTRPLA